MKYKNIRICVPPNTDNLKISMFNDDIVKLGAYLIKKDLTSDVRSAQSLGLDKMVQKIRFFLWMMFKTFKIS